MRNLRQELADLLPLGYTNRDPFANVYETADAILELIADHATELTPRPEPWAHPDTMIGRR